MAIIGSFNGFFKHNKTTEEKLNSRFGEGAFSVYSESVDDLVNNYKNGISVDFFETARLKNASSIKQRLEEAKTLKGAMSNGEKIISYDVETLGALNSKNFAITEYSAMMKDYGTNKVEPLVQLNMGINENIFKSLQEDVKAGFNGNMSESAKVTMERIPYIFNKDGSVANVELTRGNVNRALNRLKSEEIRYGDVDVVASEILKASQSINSVKDSLTIGYNIKNFDNQARSRMLKTHGLQDGILSTNREIDIQEIFMAAFDTEIHGMYEKRGMGNVSGKFKVENLAKLFGVDAGTSHVAADDTMTVFKILESSFDGGEETVLDVAIKNIEAKINNGGYTNKTVNDNIVFRAINSNSTVENFNFNKSANPNGSISADGFQKQLDFMVDNYSGKPMKYRDRSSSRGLFYRAGEMRVIPKEYLSEETLKAIGESAQEAYVLPLTTMGNSNFGHTSYIIRSSKEEIEDILSSNFKSYNLVNKIDSNSSPYDISEKVAKAQEDIYFNDLARRNFDAMFEAGGEKDFNYTSSMYGAYEELNSNYQKLGGKGKLNNTQIKELTNNGKIKVGENELTLMDHATNLRRTIPDPANKGQYIKGDLITEWVRDFNYMYGYLDDTNDIISPMLEEIQQNITLSNGKVLNAIKGASKENRASIINRIKKETLSNSYNELLGAINESLGNEAGTSIFNEVINPFDINFYNYADVLKDGKYTSMNITTLDSTMEGLGKLVYRNNRAGTSAASTKNYALSNLISITKDLNSRGIISDEMLEQISTTGDVNTSVKAIAKDLFDYSVEAKNGLPDEELIKSYIKTMLTNNYEDETLKKLTNLRGGTASIRDLSGIRINNMSFRDYVLTNSEELSGFLGVDNIITDVVERNSNIASSVFNLNVGEKTLNYINSQNNVGHKVSVLPEGLVSYLRNNVGYNDNEIAAITDMLYGISDNGSYERRFGYITRGYGATFVTGTNKGDPMHGFLIYDPSDTNEVLNAYMRGEVSPKAAFQPIPTVNNAYGRRYIKQGNSNKMITEDITAFYGGKSIDTRIPILKEGNTITNAIDSSRIVADSFDDLMKAGKGEEASRLVNNRYNKVIGNEIGTSAYRRIGNKKQFVANMNDLMEYKKAGGLMSFLPELYGEPDIQKELDTLFGHDVVQREMNRISDSVYKNEINSHQMSGDMQEWYLKNLFDGKNLAERMKKLPNIGKNNLDIIESAINEVKNGSMLVKESMTGKYATIYSKQNPVNFDPFSEYDNPVRPLHNQRLGIKAISYEELINNAKERGVDNIQELLRGNGVYLGSMTRASEANLKFNLVSSNEGRALYEGLSIKASQMPSAAYYERFNQINPEEIRKRFTIKTNKPISMEDVDYILRAYSTNGGTYEQHSVLRPSIAKYAGPKPETVSVKLNGVNADEFKLGDVIDNNSIVSRFNIDSDIVDLKYDNVPGTIVDIDYESNTLQIEPRNKSFNEIKVNLGGEKTVSTPVLGKNDIQYEFSEFLYNEMFGEDVSLVGHMEFGKHKNAGAIIQNQFDTAIEMLNRYGNENEMVLFATAINRSGLGWNLSYEKDPRTGLYHAVKHTSDVDGNAFEMLNNAFDEFYRTSRNPELVNAIKNELNYNRENNLYRTTLRFAELNESLQAAENELGRGIKDTPRKRQVFGAEALDGYRTIDKYGEVQKIVQPIIDMNLDTIKDGTAFKKAYVDMGNIYNTSRAISGNTDGIKILEKDLLGLDVNSKNLTIDLLKNNIYGINADEYSVLKLNLKNQRVVNPVTKVKEDFIYLPVLHTNIINNDQIYPSKSQGVSAELIRMLSIKENLESLEGTRFENYEDLAEMINREYANVFNLLPYEYSNKNGIVNKALASGRVDMSGMSLTAGIIPPEFVDANKTKLRNSMGNQAIRLVDGKPVYDDIVWTSKEYLESMGYNSKTIGKQLYNNNFMDNMEFKRIIEENGLLKGIKETDVTDDIFEQIGDLYASKIGINAIATREPTFHTGATKATKVMLNDTMEGYSVMLTSWMAGPQNADIDGDNEFIQLLGLKKTNDGVVLRSSDDEINVAVERLLKLQNRLNEEYVNSTSNQVTLQYNKDGVFEGKYVYTDSKDARKYTISGNVMTEIIEDEFGMEGNINFFSKEHGEKIRQLGIKARQNKAGIGYISNENFKIREMAFHSLDKDYLNKELYNDVIKFTQLTEQKIIDVKHSNIEKLTVAPKYQSGIKLMGNATGNENLNKGFESVVEAIRDSGVYGDDIIGTAKDIIRGEFQDNEGNRHLRAVYDLFRKDDLREIYKSRANNPIQLNRLDDKDNVEKAVKETMDFLKTVENSDTDEQILSKIEKNNISLIKKAAKGNNVVMDHIIVGEDSILREKGGSSPFKLTSIDNLNGMATLQNLDTEEYFNVFSNSEKSLDQVLGSKYDVMIGRELDEVMENVKPKRTQKDIYLDRLFSNPDEVPEILKATELDDEVLKAGRKRRNKLLREQFKDTDVNIKKMSDILSENFDSNGEFLNTIKRNYSATDFTLIEEGYDRLNTLYKNNKLKRSEFSEYLTEINNNIIRKGRDAKLKREQMNEYITSKTMDVAKRYSQGRDFNQINSQISQHKIYDIDSMRSSYAEALMNNKNRIMETYDDEKVAKTLISKGEETAQGLINEAVEYNEKAGLSKTLLYAENYDYKGGREALLNWNSSTERSVRGLLDNPNMKLTNKEFNTLSNAKIGFGEFADARLRDLDIDTLKGLIGSQASTSNSEIRGIMEESQRNINAYVSYVVNNKNNLSNEYRNASKNITKMQKPLDNDFGVEKLNKRLLELAEEKRFNTENAAKETVEGVSKNMDEASKSIKKLFKNKKVLVGVAGAGAAAVALSVLGGRNEVNPGKIDNEANEQINTKAKPVVYEAPPSAPNNNRGLLEGIKMKITGKSNNEIDNRQLQSKIASTFKNSVGNEVTINTSEEDNREDINDSWLKDKISKLIN